MQRFGKQMVGNSGFYRKWVFNWSVCSFLNPRHFTSLDLPLTLINVDFFFFAQTEHLPGSSWDTVMKKPHPICATFFIIQIILLSHNPIFWSRNVILALFGSMAHNLHFSFMRLYCAISSLSASWFLFFLSCSCSDPTLPGLGEKTLTPVIKAWRRHQQGRKHIMKGWVVK